MKNYIEKSQLLIIPLIKGLLRYWPITCPAKEVIFITEIEEIIEMKITHRKNIDRRRDKFGFESVSNMGLNVAGADVIQDSDEENPFGDDVGGNVKSFNDMDPAQMGQGRAKGDVPF